MAYRNKTFVSFASEDIAHYRIMMAWNANEHIDFNFHDAHDLNTALDTSQPETIRRRLRERLANTKQVVMLIGDSTRSKAADPSSFIHYEAEVISHLDVPVVLANLNGHRGVPEGRIPDAVWPLNTVSVAFRAKIIRLALDGFPDEWQREHQQRERTNEARRVYNDDVYRKLDLLE